MINYIIVFMLIISGITMAIQWTLQFHFDSITFIKLDPNKWNPAITCNNKWKNGDKKQGEKFLGSSTIFAWTTDPFHLFQAITLECIFLAFSFKSEITQHFYYDFIILRCAIGIPFQICYTLFQTKK